MNMRCDPDWADHAREDWIFEQHQKELQNGNIDRRTDNKKGSRVYDKAPKLQSSRVEDGVPIFIRQA
jgi:hypothetical protein